jgi:hypothetical protein
VGVSFSKLSLGWFACQKTCWINAAKAEPSETPWHDYDGTPTNARVKSQPTSEGSPARKRKDLTSGLSADCLAALHGASLLRNV